MGSQQRLINPVWLPEERVKYDKWRVRAHRFLVESLGPRIGVLKDQVYPGYGYHYDWVRRVTKLSRLLEQPLPDDNKLAVAALIVRRLAVKMLAAEVAAAERYVAERGQRERG